MIYYFLASVSQLFVGI